MEVVVNFVETLIDEALVVSSVMEFISLCWRVGLVEEREKGDPWGVIAGVREGKRREGVREKESRTYHPLAPVEALLICGEQHRPIRTGSHCHTVIVGRSDILLISMLTAVRQAICYGEMMRRLTKIGPRWTDKLKLVKPDPLIRCMART